MSARRLLISGTLLVLVALGLVLGLAGKHPRPHRAPALPAQTLSGEGHPVTLASLRGKPVFVTFWASWCGPCTHEAPALERFARGLAGHATLVGVDWEDGSAGARSFVRHYGWSFPVLRDSEGTVGQHYGLGNLPTTYVIDGSGRLRETLKGPQTESSLDRALKAVSS